MDMKKNWKEISPELAKKIVELAMQDRISFDTIEKDYGFNHGEVVKIMRRNLKPASFRRWRERSKRPSLSKLKHLSRREFFKDRICPTSFLKKDHS